MHSTSFSISVNGKKKKLSARFKDWENPDKNFESKTYPSADFIQTVYINVKKPSLIDSFSLLKTKN